MNDDKSKTKIMNIPAGIKITLPFNQKVSSHRPKISEAINPAKKHRSLAQSQVLK
jgi:hypothetical protein